MKELQIIKKTILETAKKLNIQIDKIILFGSRARGDYKEDSDWDILIITKSKLPEKVKWEFWEELDWELAKYVIPQIIVVDKESFEKYKQFTGFLYYWAEKEGIIIK